MGFFRLGGLGSLFSPVFAFSPECLLMSKDAKLRSANIRKPGSSVLSGAKTRTSFALRQ